MQNVRVLFFLSLFFIAGKVLAAEFNLKFDYPVTVMIPNSNGNSEVRDFARGVDIKLESEQVYWVESKGKVPILIVPNTYSSNESINLKMAEVANWPSSTMKKVIDNKMAALMDLMTQFQQQLSRKNVDGAEQILNRMAVIEDMPVLDIFRAYLAYMRGDVEKAKATVQRALDVHPDNSQAQELLKILEGKRK